MTRRVSKIGEASASPLISKRRSVDEIREYLGTTLTFDAIKRPKKPSTIRTIVAVGDLHGNPHPAMLPLIIGQKPDLIIVGGDIYDQAAFSTHPKGYGEKTEAFENEQVRVRAWYETLLTHTLADMITMRGNHDDRFFKQLMDLLPPHFLPFVTDPLDVLFAGLPTERCKIHSTDARMHHSSLPDEAMGKLTYMLPLGDALLSHANFTGGETTTAVEKLAKWVGNWYQPLGWPDPSLLIQFHTHQWVYLRPRAGMRVLAEPGMAGMPAVEGYKIGYQSKWRPGTLGAVSFKQEIVNGEWKTLLSSVTPLVP